MGFITGLITEGFLPVFLTLLRFLPTVVVLLVLVAMFEKSGLVLGFSCTTLAVGVTGNNKKLIRFLTFIPCSAKLPMLIFITTIILGWTIFGVFFLYLLSLFLGLILGGYRVLECPKYRRVNFKEFVGIVFTNVLEFLKRISVGLLLAVTVLYTLTYFGWLLPLMSLVSPFFVPIGLGNPLIIACLLFGLIAKEMLIGAILTFGVGALEFTTASALSFVVFVLLYTPCLPAMTAIKSKLGWRGAFSVGGFSFAVAYIVSLLFYMSAVIINL